MSVADIKVDLAAMRAQALAVWNRLTIAQKAALRRARFDGEGVKGRLAWNEHARVVASLVARELVDPIEHSNILTPEAVIIRREGIAFEARQAKRSYRKRRAT